MESCSEQKSKYKPYSEAIVSRARPPMIKKPNNLFLTGDIELFPEYRTSYVPYSLDSVYKFNKPPCCKRDKKSKKPQPQPQQELRQVYIPTRVEEPPQIMSERNKPLEAKILNNNYGVPCQNRYHQKLDTENNYLPEYKSKYQPVAGKRSSLIPQSTHLGGHDGDVEHFRGTSEYTNRYKSYDHFTKSAPIKKQDNLHMIGNYDMRPEYTERYKKIDMNTFERRYPYRQQDNLQSEGDFGREMPEYHEKYKDHHISAFPERAKPRNDFLCLNGEMDYSAEYRNNYVEFPRQRPIVKRPPTNVRMPSSHEIDPRDRKKDNVGLPINLPYHENGSTRPFKSESQEEEIPIECRPEYRRAMRSYMIKERSPSRAANHEIQQQIGKTTATIDPNDVGKILSENKVNIVQEKIFDDNNEVIVEPLKRPENFKIPTRSPVRHPTGKGPTYPLQKDNRFNEPVSSQKRNSGRAGNMKVVIDDYDLQHPKESYSYDSDQQQEINAPFQANMKKSPKFGRRAPNPTEDYNLRTKTNVVEANPRYVRERRSDIQPNRHEQRGYYQPQSVPMTSNYEFDKQQHYRESLRNENTPFVVIDQQQTKRNSVKPNTWMKKQWYDTQ